MARFLIGGQALTFWMDHYGVRQPDSEVLLDELPGLDGTHVEANAVQVTLPAFGVEIRVMHPLDVLRGLSAGLHEPLERPLRLAIEVARAYFNAQIDTIERDAALAEHDRDRAIFDLISAVDEYSAEDAARKNAARHGIHLADAIPAWRIHSPVFWSKQWQFLRARMSPAYAAECERRR